VYINACDDDDDAMMVMMTRMTDGDETIKDRR
jgi:hypothetical protein